MNTIIILICLFISIVSATNVITTTYLLNTGCSGTGTASSSPSTKCVTLNSQYVNFLCVGLIGTTYVYTTSDCSGTSTYSTWTNNQCFIEGIDSSYSLQCEGVTLGSVNIAIVLLALLLALMF